MPDYQKELVEYRLQTAQEKLHSAKILLDAGEYKDSIGRSYYAMFSAIRAILALDKVDFSKHAGVIAYSIKEYDVESLLEQSRYHIALIQTTAFKLIIAMIHSKVHPFLEEQKESIPYTGPTRSYSLSITSEEIMKKLQPL